MHFIGQKSILLAREMLADQCPNCASNHSLEMEVFQKYIHFIYIPYLPSGKTGLSFCSNCKLTIVDKDMPSNQKAAYQQLKAKTLLPIWMFSGLALMILLILFLQNHIQS